MSDAEEQLRQLDRRAREWLQRGEEATDHLVAIIEKEVLAQVPSRRREVDDLSRRLAQFPDGSAAEGAGEETPLRGGLARRGQTVRV